MRILMCCADWGVPLGGNGGSSVHFRSMAEALASLGHEVRLVVTNQDGPVKPSFPVTGVPYRQFWPAFSAWVESMRGRVSLPPVPAPAALPGIPEVQKSGFDPEFASGSRPSWKTRFYYQHMPRVLDRFEEFIFHPRSFGRAVERAMAGFRPHAVYERYALGQTGASRAVRRFGGERAPHLLEVNASLAFERAQAGDMSDTWNWWNKREEHRLWRSCQRVLCVSGRLRDVVVGAGTDPGRVRVIPNGVNLDVFSPKRAKGALRNLLGASREEVLVGWLGSLSKGRGAEEFLRILAAAIPMAGMARGVVIGDGPLAGECHALARDMGLSGCVDFIGSVEHERVPELLVDLDVAVASYPRQEGFYFSPLKVAEYLACGLAVVAGRTGQMMDMVTDEVNGVLAEPGDIQAWAEAVAGLCLDGTKRDILGEAARKAALAGPTWEKNAKQVEREIMACMREIAGLNP